MDKAIDKKRLYLVIAILFVALIVSICLIALVNNSLKDTDTGTTTTDYQEVTDTNEETTVSSSTVETLYSDNLTLDCDNAFTWNINTGETITIDDLDQNKIDACNTDSSYQSKLVGYSYEDTNVVVYVNVVKIENSNVYDLDNNLLGTYSEDTIDTLLDNGTTYKYLFSESDGNYTLASVTLES